MKQVTIETVLERVAELDCLDKAGVISLRGGFELACLQMLATALYAREPFFYLRVRVRTDHAEWSQATFGNVGPIGPLKHLAKEAMEAAAAPGDLSEWADVQFLLWDAQRRAGITDEQITQAMIDKLAVNKARQWPEPKDGEPRLHIQPDNDNTAQQFEALATSAPRQSALSQAIGDVIAERQRQVSAEGWTPGHDDEYEHGELADAAGCYALSSELFDCAGEPPRPWPWPDEWWKPTNRRRDLVKAGALILAEIERIDRMTTSAGGGKK